MIVAAFPAGPLQANCYLLGAASGGGCVVVDPGMGALAGVREVGAGHDLTPEAVLVTHGHFDHVWDAAAVAAEYDVPVWVHPADRHLLADPMAAVSTETAAMLRGQLSESDLSGFTVPDDVRDAEDGAVVEAGGLALTVTHVPGHTPGTVMYGLPYDGPEDVSRLQLTGDFLFAGSIGRTDLAGGDHQAMLTSLRDAVLTLPDDVAVLPGHGPQTTIGHERATNPFLADLAPGSPR